jgi:hypothetical protein
MPAALPSGRAHGRGGGAVIGFVAGVVALLGSAFLAGYYFGVLCERGKGAR